MKFIYPAVFRKKHLKMQAESVIIIPQRVAGMRKSSWASPPLSLFRVSYVKRKNPSPECSGEGFCYAFPEGQATSPSQRTQPPLC